MSADEKDDAKKPEKGPGFIQRLLSAPKKITSAGCASVLTFFFLLTLVIVVWVVYFIDPNNVPWRHSMSWTRMIVEVLLVCIIPFVVYRAIRLWLEGDKSRFPDIDYAWRDGLEALRRAGINIRSAPAFLIIGSPGTRLESVLVQAAGLSLRVKNIPEGPAPIHWYAGPDAIYLFCTDAGWASALAALLEKRQQQSGGPIVSDVISTSPAPLPASRPAQPARPAPAPAAARRGGDAGRGTIMLDQFISDVQTQEAAAAAKTSAQNEPEENESSLPASTSTSSGGDQPAILPPRDAAERVQRLQYVCQLLRQARYPLCPTNGMLSLLSLQVLQTTPRESEEMQRAIRTDLITVQRELAVRCPVTTLVVDMQSERGFREIVRRVGRERANTQRFGRRFDVRTLASVEQMSAFCIHLGGVFEDWIHTLFREADALSRPGNTRLYGLLCRIRSSIMGSLRDVLSGGLGYDSQQKLFDEPVPFSGCYFAATGETEDQQAFVKGVFEKLIEEQEEVEWTKRASSANGRYQLIALASVLASVGLVVTLVVVLVVRIFW